MLTESTEPKIPEEEDKIPVPDPDFGKNDHHHHHYYYRKQQPEVLPEAAEFGVQFAQLFVLLLILFVAVRGGLVRIAKCL